MYAYWIRDLQQCLAEQEHEMFESTGGEKQPTGHKVCLKFDALAGPTGMQHFQVYLP